MPKNKKIKIGIVGCGYWGPNLLRNFVQNAESEVVFVCDQKLAPLKRMKAIYPFLKVTPDFEKMLEEKVEAVVIATPLESHYSFVKKALKAGRHVLVEKPFVANSKQAKELIKLALRKKLLLMVDHTFEYSVPVKKIKKIYQKGELGRVYTIDMVRVNLGLFRQDHNVVWDLGYHDVSILIYVLEKMPRSVIATGSDFIQEGVEDSAYVVLKFPGKTLASLRLSWLDPYKIRRATFVGSKKMLVYDDTRLTEKIKIFKKGVSVNNHKLPKMNKHETFEEFSYLYRHGDILTPHLKLKEPLKLVTRHFIKAIKKEQKVQSGGCEGLKVIRVLEAANLSLKKGGREVKI